MKSSFFEKLIKNQLILLFSEAFEASFNREFPVSTEWLKGRLVIQFHRWFSEYFQGFWSDFSVYGSADPGSPAFTLNRQLPYFSSCFSLPNW
jgi:hypothetical protein